MNECFLETEVNWKFAATLNVSPLEALSSNEK